MSTASRTSSPPAVLAALLGTLSVACFALLATVPADVAEASPAFSFTSGFPWFETGRLPQDLVTADFDGDGIADLATADLHEGGVSVLLAKPDGTFRSRVAVASGPSPVALTAVDTDDDGKMDLVVANREAGTLSVLRGRGNGSFASPRSLPVGESPTMFLARDLTGDGIVDLAVKTGGDPGEVSVLRGRGSGVFDSPQVVVSGVRLVAMTAADLTGNGRHAIAVATADGRVLILAANPGQHFLRAAEVEVLACPRAIAASDLDRDGYTDLAVAVCADPMGGSTAAGKLVLLRGKGNGQFAGSDEIPTDFIPSSLVIADLNLDGHPDLVGTDPIWGEVVVLLRAPGGGFSPSGRFRMGSGAAALVTGDWNLDGLPDLAALDPDGLAVVMLPGNGDGSFGGAPHLDTSFAPASIWLGDVDADGAHDLVMVDRFTNRLSVLRGDGRGAFQPQSDANTHVTLLNPLVVVGDTLRSGGPIDLVVAHSIHQGFLSVGRNQGDGTFAFTNEDPIHTGGNPIAFALRDVNRDGALDAIVANRGSNTIAVLLGDGAGGLNPGTPFPSGGIKPASLALGDVDGDALLDLVVANEHSHTIALFHGLGTGEFQPVQEILTGTRPLAVALADLNEDGHLDLVTGQGDFYPSRGLVIAYFGDGNGQFAPFSLGVTARVGYEPVALAVEDLDRDGVLDVAVANAGSSSLTLLRGQREGRFEFGPRLDLGTGTGAGTLAARDVDRDGRMDLLVAGIAAPGVAVFLNRTGDPPAAAVYPAVDIEPGQCPNLLNTDAGGFLRAALLGGVPLPGGDAGLDPTEVHPDSVSLQGVPAWRASPMGRDVSGRPEAGGTPCQCPAGAPDGVPDVVFEFDARAVAARLEPVRDGEQRTLHFEARLADGRVIRATDCVVIATRSGSAREGRSVTDGRPGLAGPNPLERGAATAFTYEVPEGGAQVRIGVYTVSGRRVAGLAHEFKAAGAHTAPWDGRDDAGQLVLPGVYFLEAAVGETRTVARIVIAR